MYIPTHYAALFLLILLAESAALFIYTVIGLLKANPYPPLFYAPDLPPCRQPPAVVHGPSAPWSPNEQFVPTTTVYETVLVAPSPTEAGLLPALPAVDGHKSLPASAVTGTSTNRLPAPSVPPASTSTPQAALETEVATATPQAVTSVVLSTTVVPAGSSEAVVARPTVFRTVVLPLPEASVSSSAGVGR